MPIMRWALTALLLLAATVSDAAEVKIVPADFIVLNPTNPDKGYSDLMVHAIIVATGARETATLKDLRVDVLAGGRAVLSREFMPDELLGGTQFLASAPFPEFVEGQVLNSKGLSGVLGRDVSFASSAAMGPSQALLAMRLHFSVGFHADAVRATATFTNGKTASADVSVKRYSSAIAYAMPLSGQWLMQAIPGVQSHHRFNPSTEFAVDFFKLGPDGHLVHGDKIDANNYPGFGAPVSAAADGTVVAVIADQVQDRAALTRRTGEAPADFYKRVDAFHTMQMHKDFRAANSGNLITIRHQTGETVEYSSYGHLKSGSVRVKVGDVVKQGQIIGEVGDTGDSAAVHLHFQINACADAFTCKSLPVAFANMHAVDNNDEMARLVTSDPQ